MNWLTKLIKNLFSKKEENNWHKDYVPGLEPSPKDFRDVELKDVLGGIDLRPLPETYLIPFVLPIKDQGSTPSCVGQACATIKDEKERREKNDFEGDGFWLYQQCKLVDNYSGRGTYFRTGLDRLAKVGIKPLPASPVQGDPSSFRIGGYARVDCDVESLKRAIIQFGAVLAGFYTYPNSWDTTYIKKGTTIIGGHATAIIGWDKTRLIGQNSFGEQWGDKGYFYFS